MDILVNKKYIKKLFIYLFISCIILAGCNVDEKVNTKEVKEFKKSILNINNTKKVEVLFNRPNLYINVISDETVNDDFINDILQETKSFITIDNIEKIKQELKWKIEISNVHVKIYEKNKNKLIQNSYLRYFKTSNASDKSEDNLELYQVWHKWEF